MACRTNTSRATRRGRQGVICAHTRIVRAALLVSTPFRSIRLTVTRFCQVEQSDVHESSIFEAKNANEAFSAKELLSDESVELAPAPAMLVLSESSSLPSPGLESLDVAELSESLGEGVGGERLAVEDEPSSDEVVELVESGPPDALELEPEPVLESESLELELKLTFGSEPESSETTVGDPSAALLVDVVDETAPPPMPNASTWPFPLAAGGTVELGVVDSDVPETVTITVWLGLARPSP